jgi:hypothetical protein
VPIYRKDVIEAIVYLGSISRRADAGRLTCIYSIGKQICHRKADRSNEANQLLFWPTQTKVVPKGIRAP